MLCSYLRIKEIKCGTIVKKKSPVACFDVLNANKFQLYFQMNNS